MEVVLGIFVLVGCVVLAIRVGRPDQKSNPGHTAPRRTQPLKRRPSKEIRAERTARFDARTSAHVDHKRILVGAAYVTDGDTIRIKNTNIRLFGIDAPEMNHPYGKKAKWALHSLCKGHIIRAEITEKDAYGRTVAQCYLPNGKDLSAEMVKQGLAIDWRKYSGGKYRNMETPDVRKKLFLADARQKGRMYVWENFEANQRKL